MVVKRSMLNRQTCPVCFTDYSIVLDRQNKPQLPHKDKTVYSVEGSNIRMEFILETGWGNSKSIAGCQRL